MNGALILVLIITSRSGMALSPAGPPKPLTFFPLLSQPFPPLLLPSILSLSVWRLRSEPRRDVVDEQVSKFASIRRLLTFGPAIECYVMFS